MADWLSTRRRPLMELIQQLHHCPAPGPLPHKLTNPNNLQPLLVVYPCLKNHPKTYCLQPTIVIYYLSQFLCTGNWGTAKLGGSKGPSCGCSQLVDEVGTGVGFGVAEGISHTVSNPLHVVSPYGLSNLVASG